MSKNATLKVVIKEIEVLNNKIDRKILTGKPYRKESLRHKFLLSQYRTLVRTNSFA